MNFFGHFLHFSILLQIIHRMSNNIGYQISVEFPTVFDIGVFDKTCIIPQ